ncbi:MAG TPA: hypothetical protein VMX17_13405 [Candidatus Glassbacteria bacterium]|nr:hypothetical protein [Candidatus Glassbacteria bacterium]
MQVSLQGKLKKTMPEKCVSCNVNLQIRVLSLENVSSKRFVENEILICPRCGNSTELKPKKKRIRVQDEVED